MNDGLLVLGCGLLTVVAVACLVGLYAWFLSA